LVLANPPERASLHCLVLVSGLACFISLHLSGRFWQLPLLPSIPTWEPGQLMLGPDFAINTIFQTWLDGAGSEWVHVDVFDGVFVPNLTIGPPVVREHGQPVLYA
jgi:hypothetical protein